LVQVLQSMEADRFLVRLTKQGPDGKRFGWSIEQNQKVVRSSTEAFDSRIDALLASARTSAHLIFMDLVDAPSDERPVAACHSAGLELDQG
jgi:hypothetical protein